MMNVNGGVCSATDAIRFVYLARTARHRGDDEAAERWQAKADQWLRKNVANGKDQSRTSEEEAGE